MCYPLGTVWLLAHHCKYALDAHQAAHAISVGSLFVKATLRFAQRVSSGHEAGGGPRLADQYGPMLDTQGHGGRPRKGTPHVGRMRSAPTPQQGALSCNKRGFVQPGTSAQARGFPCINSFLSCLVMDRCRSWPRCLGIPWWLIPLNHSRDPAVRIRRLFWGPAANIQLERGRERVFHSAE
jgi:hypothetical protein